MTQTQPPLTRAQIRKVFAANRGAATQLAKDVGKSKVSVSNVLRGRLKSAQILDAAREMALLLMEESKEQAA